MPVMNVTHLLLVSSGHKMVSDVKTLILVDIGCLLLARSQERMNAGLVALILWLRRSMS